ncbi:MAG: hypothetical protein HC819_12830 [Cyclobacteriaceae bacterium]|nr:hypothetical protein [Cyclobacteriaceae bacterium]
MKQFKLSSLLIILFLAIFQFSCEPESDILKSKDSILPERFGVEIPDALSQQNYASNGRVAIDTLQGNLIYGHLSNFINVGESASEFVAEVIGAIAIYRINKPMSLTFQGEEDGRAKNMVVEEEPTFEGETWEFVLTITDAASEAGADGGKGLQIFWNRSPIRGVALLKAYNIDRNTDFGQAVVRIDYSETGDHGYENDMIVSIADLPLADPLDDPYSMTTLKMYAGKNGDFVDVFGNSNHPNATFFAGNSGFNWAFVASGSRSKEIGVAEVALPPSSLDETSRNVILKDYSIKKVFTEEIYDVWPNIGQQSVDAFLFNTGAPGYFAKQGFVSGGTSPGSAYDALESRLNALSPYNPKDISNLKLSFK